MATVVDEAWARRVSRESWAQKTVRKSLRSKGDAAREYLSAAHADKIGEAVRYVDWGASVLQEMLSEAAGPEDGQERAPKPGQVTGTGGLPRGDYPGQRPETVGVGHVRINRGVVEIDPAEAHRMMRGMEAFKTALIRDATETFATVAEAVGAKKIFPGDSAAYAHIEDIIAACLKGASEIIERHVAEAAREYRTKA